MAGHSHASDIAPHDRLASPQGLIQCTQLKLQKECSCERPLEQSILQARSYFRVAETSDSFKETNNMDRRLRQMTSGLRVRSVTAAALAVGGLSASALAVGPAGAMTSHVAKAVVVSTVKSAKFGKVLASGKTLYTLQPSATACTAQCLKVWPELVLPKGVTKAKAGPGVSASKLGTVTRGGGVRQVTYAGKPLYSFVGDTGTGQVNGNVTDTWGTWSAVVTAKASGSSSSGSSSGGSTAGSGGTAF
jgi:predicted lipoprotein with Yx(FWY)xxD motif